jgi:uncharacterized repeat protein (TIGR01451 family)
MLRRSLLLAVSTCLLAAALTAPAWSALPFTPACQNNFDCLGLDQPAMGDSVVLRWRAQSATTQTVVLESRQRVGGGGTVTTAATGPVTVEGGALREFDARLPIAQGGVLAITGASGPIQAEATVLGDYDSDGFAGSDDACADNAAVRVLPCPETTTFGSSMLVVPDPRGFAPSGAGNPTGLVVHDGGSQNVTAAHDGVITRVRFRSATPDALTVQILHPVASGAEQVTSASPPATPVAGGAVTTVSDLRLPVKAGDRLGVLSPGAPGAIAAFNNHGVKVFGNPPPAVGETATPSATPADYRLLVQADLEPDVDGDGYGDVTQDVCPFDAARHAGCHADLAVSSNFSSAEVNPGKHAFFELSVTNKGPDPAKAVDLRIALPPGTAFDGNLGGCPSVDGVWTCHVDRLDPGNLNFVERFFVSGVPGTTVTLTASATSATPDPDAGNNQLTSTVTFRAPFTTPTWISPELRPCVNVIRGTRDDDVLRGTAFGDRLVGNDGDDLLKGNGAGDCLEGGAGNDVLDGGDGDDRLAGSSGKDRLIGGRGNDKLTGGKGNDRLTGGTGNDTFSPGSGRDTVTAGSGNDTVNSVDGVRETIDCGPGKDTVRADRRDRLKRCEKVKRR